ncbi:MAG TPA: hypothetical protein PKH65_09430 [Bacteroidia bacterium]|nr:hypothetical protein [Bacteroidia bacterium]HNT80889.1 hypothetical protein [Bacteroidia bacterium]
MPSIELFKYFLQKKTYILILLIIFTLIGFYCTHYLFRNYKSTTGFFVSSPSELGSNIPEKVVFNVLTDENAILTNRIFRICHSDSMYQHLISTFNLYKVYNINVNDSFAYPKMVRKLTSKIKLKKVSANFIDLTVSSNDPYLSANMANEITRKLNEINSNILKNNISNKIDFYLKLSEKLNEEFEKNNQIMNQLFDELMNHKNNKTLTINQSEEIYNRLLGVTSSMNSTVDKFVNSKVMSDFILQRVIDDSIESIVVTNKAIPEVKSDLFLNLVLSLILGLIATILIMCSAVLVDQIRNIGKQNSAANVSI